MKANEGRDYEDFMELNSTEQIRKINSNALVGISSLFQGSDSCLFKQVFLSLATILFFSIFTPSLLKATTSSTVSTIDYHVFNLTCSDNATPNDPSDDVFSFTLIAENPASSTGWNALIDGAPQSGNYDEVYILGPYAVSSGNQVFDLIDNLDPTCTSSVTVIPPSTCSDTCRTYTVVRTWTATDDCDNTSTESQTVEVEDTQAPVFSTLASDVTFECDGSGNYSQISSWINSNGGATATDNCGNVYWENDFSSLPNGCSATGTVSVTFTAKDACGNDTTTIASFTIEDTTEPNLTLAAQDTIVECDGLGNIAELNAWISNNGGAIGSDGCSENNITWTNDYAGGGAPALPSCDNDTTNVLTVWFFAEDACGLSDSTSARFIIIDSTEPNITITASDTIVQCDGFGNLTDLSNWLSNLGGASGADGCNSGSGLSWSNNYGGGGVPALPGCTNDTTNILEVIFYATDDCDRVDSTTARFIIIDTNDPTITVSAQDTVVECDGSGNSSDLANWLNNAGGATVDESCGTGSGLSWTNNYDGNGVPALTSCNNDTTNVLNVTFYATDDCGNVDSTSSRFYILDTSTPTVTATALDTTVECNGIGNTAALTAWLNNNGGATAADGCNSGTGFSWSNNYGGGGVPSLPSCVNDTTNVLSVTFYATDDCGNVDSTSAQFVILDTTDPIV
ncbi:MAG: hypothetical protein HKN16_00005, partial [Saprospiraceae bacterium]|nr:hypothetical protein [Saprospiraceae bacterium]